MEGRMRIFVALVALAFWYFVFVLIAQGPQPQPGACTDCPDPSRPWMRGVVEKSCASPRALAQFRKDNPDRVIEECHCQHHCNPLDPNAAMTDDREWDPRCAARCDPKNCTCEHPCES